MVKVFTTNSNGKIEFTKEELENLLNEVWNDGYYSNHSYWWSSPGTPAIRYNVTNVTNGADESVIVTYSDDTQ